MSNYLRNTVSGLLAPLNAELEKIEQSLMEKLDRKPVSSQINSMSDTLDMNSNRLINLPEPLSPNEPVRLRDLQDNGASVAQSIAKSFGVFDVTQYGALGDGTTDNAVAIDLAIAEIQALGGGVLLFPKGVYRTSKAHSIVNNMSIEGIGMHQSILKKTTGSDNDALFSKPNPEAVITNFSIQKIRLEGTWSETRREGTGSLVSARNIRNVIVNEVYFIHARFFSLNLNLCTNVIVENCKFLYGCRDMCGVWNGSNVIIANNFFKGNDDDCISLNSDSFPTNAVVKTKLTIVNNQLEDTGGIKIQNANTAIIANNILQRNKGNAQITIQGVGFGGLYGANPQSIIVQNNLMTDIIDRFLSANLTPSVNVRLGIKIETEEGTVANEITDPYNFFYTDTGPSGTAPVRTASGIFIKDNVIKRTLPAVSNYTDWGFGEMFTRFSTDSFAPNGFANPQILEAYMQCRPVEIEGPLKNCVFRDNYFEHSCLDAVSFQAEDGKTITDNYYTGVRFLNNVFKNCSGRAMNLTDANNTSQDILFKGNLFDLDPLFSANSRNANGSWTGVAECVGIYASNVDGVQIIDNVFMNMEAPYIQGASTSTIFKFNNTFVGEPVAGATTGVYNVGNKGLGIYPEEVKDATSSFIYRDSDPTSPNYGSLLAQQEKRVSGNLAPSSGYYFDGQFIPSDDGTLDVGLVTLGHRRLTSGTGTVAGTDWLELKASV